MVTVDVVASQAPDPELQNVPIEYLVDKLRTTGKGMPQAACSSATQPPTNCYPRELELFIRSSAFTLLSHISAVYSRTPNDQDTASKKTKNVALHPAHGIVLAAHCANLPLSPTPERSSEPSSSPRKLPIAPSHHLIIHPHFFSPAFTPSNPTQRLFVALLLSTQPSQNQHPLPPNLQLLAQLIKH